MSKDFSKKKKKWKNNVEGNRPFEMKDNDEVRKKNYGDQRNFGKGLEKEIKKKKRENGKKL